jgi:GTPase Era involved in 16S rRNA processing
LNYSKEIPYAVEIVTEKFEDENIIRIRSWLWWNVKLKRNYYWS